MLIFEFDGRFVTQCWMSAFWIIEPLLGGETACQATVYIFSKLDRSLLSCLEWCTLDQFIFDGFEYRLYHGIVVAISLSTHSLPGKRFHRWEGKLWYRAFQANRDNHMNNTGCLGRYDGLTPVLADGSQWLWKELWLRGLSSAYHWQPIYSFSSRNRASSLLKSASGSGGT